MSAESFLSVANLLPEPAMLVAADGGIRAANAPAGECFGLAAAELAGRNLAELVGRDAERLAAYLRTCSRSRSVILGSIEIGPAGQSTAYRSEGAVYRPRSDDEPAQIFLRLFRREAAAGQFLALNMRIDELAQEVALRKETEEALRANREWLSVTLASIGDAVIATDERGQVSFLNPQAEALTGWSQADAAGRPLDDIFVIVNEATRAVVENPVARALREGTVVGLANHTVLIAKDGCERPIDDSAAPIRDREGKIGGVVLIFRDVTERKRHEDALQRAHDELDGQVRERTADLAATNATLLAEVEQRRLAEDSLRKSEERFRLLIEAVTDYAIFMLKPDGTIASWNAGAQRIKGYRAEEIIGRHFSQFYTPVDLLDDKPARELRIAAAEGRYEEEGWRVRKDGTLFWSNVVITALRAPSGELVGYSKVTRDMTERKQREEAMLQLHRDLELRVAERTVELATSNRALEAEIAERRRTEELLKDADRRKDEFLAMLAHELRNPLAPVRNGLEVLRLAGPDAPTIEQVREMLDRQIQQMTRLIDDLLDVSRITRGKIQLRQEPMALAAPIERAVEAVRPLLEERGHKLEMVLPPSSLRVHGDIVRLAQVFTNLLTNAAKFTEPGGRIFLSAERVGETCRVRVRDTGVGLTKELIPTIFDLFTQSERSLDRSPGGLGVGLTVVKTLLEMHGASIEAHSDGPGRGSEFVVQMPILSGVAGVQPAAPRPAEPYRPPVRHRVLVVDDNEDAANSLGMLLRLWGHSVHTAFDGPQALQLARSHKPEVVLLDIGLPGMTGYEVAEELRRIPGLEKVLVLGVTGYGQDEDRRRSRAAGFDHHFTKPVDPDMLRSLLAGTPVPSA